jgi:hypothetical protein
MSLEIIIIKKYLPLNASFCTSKYMIPLGQALVAEGDSDLKTP